MDSIRNGRSVGTRVLKKSPSASREAAREAAGFARRKKKRNSRSFIISSLGMSLYHCMSGKDIYSVLIGAIRAYNDSDVNCGCETVKKYTKKAGLLLGMAVLLVFLQEQLMMLGTMHNIDERTCETAGFRAQQLGEDAMQTLLQLKENTRKPASSILSIWFGTGEVIADMENISGWEEHFLEYDRKDYEILKSAYSAIWDDVVCFPVTADVGYEDSWMAKRTYGGERGHEGTDLMPPENRRACYEVLSMTDGVVEQVGWLPQGGWRIGIRSLHGGYFYYAHLDSYAEDFAVGDEIAAGDFLGFMGDSGYSRVVGTRGKFDVHLHLGIYIKTKYNSEISVNPYWILRYLEMQKLK